MKLYDFNRAPNPRRVRIFAAEKGVDIELVTVDLGAREQTENQFKAINPRQCVPALELDDGTIITESVAICRYLDEIKPKPSLFGTSALSKANVEMWHRRVEHEGLSAVADAVRNSIEFFKDRALAGPNSFAQIPELAERGLMRIDNFYQMLDQRLQHSSFISGDEYTVADIAALCALDFARVVKKRPREDQTALRNWHGKVSSRPSAKA
ncbi:MAG: hypothetical protein CBB68_12275 [Rhodospirillaceae bacterium TMED8]|nr:glutathione S-transferase [Magnetovibrio sp.]OUT48889.1 MAG: hypothetical protein CBB68_12275 [Rhodospirillaceae bacterium TMED8]